MSVSLTLNPLAIALSAILGREASQEIKEKSPAQLVPLQTIFNSPEILEQTLRERGLEVAHISENQMVSHVGSARLDYARRSAAEPFWVTVSGVENTTQLIGEMEYFEREYRQNVQSFTYNKLKENIAESTMQIAEELVLEDNSILLTIDV
ncbi:MAG: hypothetical protein FWE48_04150 [Coriobacteriia bacterium]|nr:hypothetical protein [Coriobacteriia bacterium]